jgi:8-oxo-dGTP pyrophosphatase MutT (NUDIX family)
VSSSAQADWRKAAVVIAIFADDPHDVIFIERAGHLRRHAGQIGFPGGSADPIDGGSAVTTALREFQEELGVAPDRVRVVGQLDEVEQILNRFLVTPVIGVLKPKTLLTIDHVETVGVFTVPLAAIVEPGAVYDDVERSIARGKKTYALDYDEHHIWGLTGRILKLFVDAWNVPGSQLRSDIESAFVEMIKE